MQVSFALPMGSVVSLFKNLFSVFKWWNMKFLCISDKRPVCSVNWAGNTQRLMLKTSTEGWWLMLDVLFANAYILYFAFSKFAPKNSNMLFQQWAANIQQMLTVDYFEFHLGGFLFVDIAYWYCIMFLRVNLKLYSFSFFSYLFSFFFYLSISKFPAICNRERERERERFCDMRPIPNNNKTSILPKYMYLYAHFNFNEIPEVEDMDRAAVDVTNFVNSVNLLQTNAWIASNMESHIYDCQQFESYQNFLFSYSLFHKHFSIM